MKDVFGFNGKSLEKVAEIKVVGDQIVWINTNIPKGSGAHFIYDTPPNLPINKLLPFKITPLTEYEETSLDFKVSHKLELPLEGNSPYRILKKYEPLYIKN